MTSILDAFTRVNDSSNVQFVNESHFFNELVDPVHKKKKRLNDWLTNLTVHFNSLDSMICLQCLAAYFRERLSED